MSFYHNREMQEEIISQRRNFVYCCRNSIKARNISA